jgi:hypothetical protein
MVGKSMRMTAVEAMRRLAADPEYQARLRDNERRNQELQRVALEEEKGIVEDLRAAGMRLASLWDLVGSKRSYPEAISVLLDHLTKPYSPRTLDGLVRALIVPEARGRAWTVLRDVALARKMELVTDAPYALGTMLYALGVLAGPDDILNMLQLLTDEDLGNYRIGMLQNTPAMACPASTLEQARAFVPDEAIARDYKKFLTRLSPPERFSRSSRRTPRP